MTTSKYTIITLLITGILSSFCIWSCDDPDSASNQNNEQNNLCRANEIRCVKDILEHCVNGEFVLKQDCSTQAQYCFDNNCHTIKDIAVENTNVVVKTGEQINVAITKGSGQYDLSFESDIIKAEIKDSQLLITGIKTGVATLTLNDIKTHKILTIDITVYSVNVADYGAIANDHKEDTKAIQNAIDKAGKDNGLVYIPKGSYTIDALTSIRPRSNVTLKFDPKAELIAIPNSKGAYRIIYIVDVENVQIIGGNIKGEKHDHTGTDGEWGMGIEIRGAKNVTLQDLSISDCWGDGIYIGHEKSQNVTIKNVKSIANRRQGMSITFADHVTVTDSTFSNNRGTSPESGIDIEPNKDQSVTNVKIQNCLFKGNGDIGFQAGSNDETITIADILVTQNRFEKNGRLSAKFAHKMERVRFTQNTFDKKIRIEITCTDCEIEDKSM